MRVYFQSEKFGNGYAISDENRGSHRAVVDSIARRNGWEVASWNIGGYGRENRNHIEATFCRPGSNEIVAQGWLYLTARA